MSDVKRYDFDCYAFYDSAKLSANECKDGDYVLHSDYATLRAENERLKGEVEGLKAQVEELNDALYTAGYEIDALVGALEG